MRFSNHRALLPAFFAVFLFFLLLPPDACAELESKGTLDEMVDRFKMHSLGWEGVFKKHATWLFWTLACISMTWTFGTLALRKADMGDFFAELVRFMLFAGFFWFLLDNGPAIANSIVKSLQTLGGEANSAYDGPKELSPSGVVDMGWSVYKSATTKNALKAMLNPAITAINMLLALLIVLFMGLIAINMALLLISAWMMAYAGVFILGFGGGRWTNEMAINYYKSILGIAIQIGMMLLIVGVGQSIMTEHIAKANLVPSISESGVLILDSIALYLLSSKVPPMVAGVIGTGGGAGAGIGNITPGGIFGAANTATGGALGKTAGQGLSSATNKLASTAASATVKAAMSVPSGPAMALTASLKLGGMAFGKLKDISKNAGSNKTPMGRAMGV